MPGRGRHRLVWYAGAEAAWFMQDGHLGRPGIRLRVGDWRVIMEDGVVLEVLEIGPRGGVYE
ncbi:hypothetical protein [Devosia sp. LC5]|uniref:type II toxin-antitoxin system RelE family toxin n=1 Tax=Devosia sp. LC5 TaxID=1502724 RepID=UPI00054FAC20|nr:hypothetical protein [Devosia sp. LC5]